MTVLAPRDGFEGYVVDAVVGHGDFATVYRVHRTGTPEPPIALKVLDEFHRGPDDLARLRHEFDVADGLRHPHVVAMIDRGPEWLAMEIGAGGLGTLRSPAERIAALADIADALDFAHARGVIHCDVRPPNVFLAADATGHHDAERGALLGDFADAVTTDGGPPRSHLEASLPYLAPEILLRRPPSAASDQYALACVTVELLTGAAPFSAPTASALATLHLDQPPPRYSPRLHWLPHAFDTIVAKALAKAPGDRYASCGDFIGALRRALRAAPSI